MQSGEYVMAGLVPAISFMEAQCVPQRDARDIRAFTPVFDGLCPGMMLSDVAQSARAF
jgi:hypothetical protein